MSIRARWDAGWQSIKFMLYLTDTPADNGAFSYVPGSHRLVHELVRAAARDGTAHPQQHPSDHHHRGGARLGPVTPIADLLDGGSEGLLGNRVPSGT